MINMPDNQMTMTKKKSTMVMTAIFLSSSMGMLLVSARSVILPTVLSDLNGTHYYSIIVVLTSMSMSAVLPLAGKLGDIFGRKIIFIIGILGYIVAGILCGRAANVYVFMMGISLTGIFYGMLNSVELALIMDVFPAEKRPKQVAFLTASYSLAALLGPVIGGAFTDSIGWQFVYYCVVPMSMIACLLMSISLPQKKVQHEKIKIDWRGILLFILFIVPLLYAIAMSGNQFNWISTESIALFSVSASAFAVLIVNEKKVDDPIIPFALFQNKSYVICLISSLVCAIAFSSMNYLPVYYQAIKEVSATVSGMLIIPRQVGQISISILTGVFLCHCRKYKPTLAAAIVLFAATLFSMSKFSLTTGFTAICLTEMMFGVSNGAASVTAQSFAQISLETKNAGSGMAFISFASAFGNSLGAAVAGGVINHSYNITKLVPQSIQDVLSPAYFNQLSSINSLKNLTLITEMRNSLPSYITTLFDQVIEHIKLSLNHGISVAFRVYFVLMILLLLLILITKWDRVKIREDTA